MESMIIDDEKIYDNNYPKGILISRIAEDRIMLYNLDKNLLGYGDDGRDWTNNDEKWVEIEEMDTHQDDETIPEGKLKILWSSE